MAAGRDTIAPLNARSEFKHTRLTPTCCTCCAHFAALLGLRPHRRALPLSASSSTHQGDAHLLRLQAQP